MTPAEDSPQASPIEEKGDEGDFQSGVVPEQELDGSISAKDNNDVPAEVYADLPNLKGPNEWTRTQRPTEVQSDPVPRSSRGQVPSDQNLRNVANDLLGVSSCLLYTSDAADE